MTEESYQQVRDVMKKASQWRSRIKLSEQRIEEWTELEKIFRAKNKILTAESAKKNIERYRANLNKAMLEFSILQLPN
jgi:hypothetical protein